MSDELFKAISRHEIGEVAELLAQGADPNTASSEPPQWHALEAAIEEADNEGPQNAMLQIAKLLIDAGADVNAWDSDQHLNPLLASVYWDNREAAKLVLEAGADPNAVNDYRDTPLSMAVEKDDVEMAKLLLQFGARESIDRIGGVSGHTPLGQAAANLNLPMIKLLVDNGADTEALDGDSQIARRYLPSRDESDTEIWDTSLEVLSFQRDAY
jgi:ankyrin repeat protein